MSLSTIVQMLLIQSRDDAWNVFYSALKDILETRWADGLKLGHKLVSIIYLIMFLKVKLKTILFPYFKSFLNVKVWLALLIVQR